MTKEQLMEMGSEEELAQQVAEAAQAELEAVKKDAQVERMLVKSGARCLPAVKAMLKDGTLEDMQAQIDALRAGEETEFLFESEMQALKGVVLGEGMDAMDAGPAKMNYEELCAYLEEHPEAKL